MHHPTDRIAYTTDFVTPVVEHWLEREIAQWVHPMKDRSDDPSHHERTLLPRSYTSFPTPVKRRPAPTFHDVLHAVDLLSVDALHLLDLIVAAVLRHRSSGPHSLQLRLHPIQLLVQTLHLLLPFHSLFSLLLQLFCVLQINCLIDNSTLCFLILFIF